MKISNVDRMDLYEALERTNRTFDNNVDFYQLRSMNMKDTIWKVRLCVERVGGKGSKRLYPQRPGENNFYQAPMMWACWHSHGEFFNNLLTIQPKARIRTGQWYTDRPYSITKDNWEWKPMNLEKKTGGRIALLNWGITSHWGKIQVDLNSSHCFCLGEDYYLRKIIKGEFMNETDFAR